MNIRKLRIFYSDVYLEGTGDYLVGESNYVAGRVAAFLYKCEAEEYVRKMVCDSVFAETDAEGLYEVRDDVLIATNYWHCGCRDSRNLKIYNASMECCPSCGVVKGNHPNATVMEVISAGLPLDPD